MYFSNGLHLEVMTPQHVDACSPRRMSGTFAVVPGSSERREKDVRPSLAAERLLLTSENISSAMQADQIHALQKEQLYVQHRLCL